MCVLRDHFSAIIGQLLNHYPRSIDEATSFKSFKISLFQDTVNPYYNDTVCSKLSLTLK